MSTKNGVNKIKEILKNDNYNDKLDFETNMLAYAFLNEIEKEADALGLKRKDLASKIGSSASYITQLFRGSKTPNLKTLVALGLSIGKLFDVRGVDSVQNSRSKIDEMNLNGSFSNIGLISTPLELKNDSNKTEMVEVNVNQNNDFAKTLHPAFIPSNQIQIEGTDSILPETQAGNHRLAMAA